MSEVDKQDKADEDEDGCANQGDVVAPEHEEAVRNKEGRDAQEKPYEHFRSPPSTPQIMRKE